MNMKISYDEASQHAFFELATGDVFSLGSDEDNVYMKVRTLDDQVLAVRLITGYLSEINQDTLCRPLKSHLSVSE